MPTPLNQLLYDQSRGYHQWHISEVYNAVDGHPGRNIPNINDTIIDPLVGYYLVTDIDLSTGLSTKQPWSPPVPSSTSLEDILLSAGPGTVSESFRAYVNNSQLPRTLTFDAQLYMFGSAATSIKVFLGTDTSDEGVVVSAYYNQNGAFVSENIPLEVVQSPSMNNVAQKTPVEGYCNRPLAENELLTVVAYGTNGAPRTKGHVLVRNTDFTRSATASALYVTNVRIVSPFMSATVANRIEYPSNITNFSAHVMGEVTYNNGHSELLPIDDTRFSLYGINAYIPTVPGQRIPVTLAYHLGVNEYQSGLNEVANRTIVEPYELVTIAAVNAYNVKIFAYPKWIDVVNGYVMQYWLYSLARDIYTYVTPWVTLDAQSPAFNPTSYGTVQHLILRLNLHSVDPDLYKDYTHVQPIDVTLVRRGDSLTVPNFQIAYTPGQTPQFGTNAVAVIHPLNVNSSTVDISCGAQLQAAWLNTVYYATQPVTYVGREALPPTPTHVILKFATFEQEITLSQWNSVLTLSTDLTQGQLLYLRFIYRNGLTDQQLAIAGLPVHIV